MTTTTPATGLQSCAGSTSSRSPAILAVVEGGGTSFRVCVCQTKTKTDEKGVEVVHDAIALPEILHRSEVDATTDPQSTLEQCAAFFRRHKPREGYDALGVATFGPVGLHEGSDSYGCILPSTPKALWRGVNLLTPLINACRGTKPLKVKLETDVNAPALAEYKQSQNCNNSLTSVAYVTVGTGVGVGLVVNGLPVHGRMHPEGGHVPIQPLPGDDFPGYSWGKDSSPFFGIHTVEGVASSVALTERLHHMMQGTTNASSLLSRSVLADIEDDDHEVWDHAANAIACLCVTLLLTLSMEKIVLGGGVLQRPGLLEKIRLRVVILLNGYLELPSDMSSLITTSAFGNDAGLMGAVVLAQEALLSTSSSKVKEQTKEEEANEDCEATRLMKQVAFRHGLWHGFLLGAVGATLVFKYVFYSLGRTRARR